MSRSQYLINLLLLLFTLNGCSDKHSPEQQVRDTIDTAIRVAESRDVSDFRNLIDDNFSDAEGHDKNTLTRIAAGYFLRNRNIHLFSQINHIHFPNPQQADVQLYLAMTGQAVTNINSLFNLRADLYQFDIKLIKQDDDWLLNNARWKRVRQDDLITN
jgi:hypothetical protein